MEISMRNAWMLLVATLLFATACGGGDDEDVTATPGATQTATEAATTPAAARTASPSATAGATATPTPTQAAELCPIAADACSFANQIAMYVLGGDGDGVISSARSTFYQCPGPNGEGQPYPLCNGATPGETRAGFPLRQTEGSGSVVNEADAAQLVSGWSGRTEPSLHDEYGDGEAQAYTIACPDIGANEGDQCGDAFSLVFSGLSPAGDAADPPLRTMLAIDAQRGEDGELRVTGFATGVLSTGLDLALRGGTGAVKGDSNVPTALAPLVDGATSVTFFAWDTSVLTR
jgi:hypothetical protein